MLYICLLISFMYGCILSAEFLHIKLNWTELNIVVGLVVFTLSEGVHQSYISWRSCGEETSWRRHPAGVSISSSATTDSHCSVGVACDRPGLHQTTTAADRAATQAGNWCKE